MRRKATPGCVDGAFKPGRALALFAVFLVSQACRPHLPDRFSPEDTHFNPPLKTMQSAPIVVVGRVLSIRSIGGIRSAARMPAVKIQLLQITLAVENVLRGTASGGTLAFYYYAFSAYKDKRLPFHLFLYTPEVNTRRIFFLQEEAGVVRCVGDVIDYTIRVRSGSHEGRTPPSPLGRAISWILLTPGRDIDPETFAESLYHGFAVAMGFDSESYALTLLETLSKSDNKSIRTEACDIVAAATIQ